MTYQEIVHYIADRFGLNSDAQLARIGTSVNMRHREIISSIGVSQVAERTSTAVTTTINNRFLTFGPSPIAVVKVLAVYNTALGTYPPPILDEVSPDELLAMGLVADPPTHYAVTTMGERSVTIQLNSLPATAYALTADVEGNATQLSGAMSPQFSEDYHDILVYMSMADELEKAEKYDKAKEKLKQAETRMGQFRLFIAKSAYKELVQGSRSHGSSGSSGGGGTAVSGWPAITTPATPMVIGDLLVATATTTVGRLADVAAGQVFLSGGVGALPVWTATLPATSGGTGRSTYAVGDLLYASTTTALNTLADVAVGSVIVSGGVGVAPAWSANPTLSTVTAAVLGIAAVSTDGIIAANTTPATAGVPVQMSPRSRWRGTAWDTAASETVDFFAEALPATAATPTGTWRVGYSLNGAAATYPMTVTSAGTLTVLQNIISGQGIFAASLNVLGWNGLTRFISNSDGTFNIVNAAQTTGVGLDATTDAVLKVRTRAQTGDATIAALLHQTMTATIAAGGGAAPTFTTIGGSGPATAAQNGWLKMLDSTGAAIYVPIWK